MSLPPNSARHLVKYVPGMSPDPLVDLPSKRRSSESSVSVFSDGLFSLSLSRPSSDADFNRFLEGFIWTDSVGLNDKSEEDRHVATETSPERHRDAPSFESGHGGVPRHFNSAHPQDVIAVPLQQWIEDEAEIAAHQDPSSHMKIHKASMIRKITVSFGIANLLQLLPRAEAVTGHSLAQLESICASDNFVLELANRGTCEPGWELEGVVMVAPFASLRIHTTSYSCANCESGTEILGRDVVAEVTCPFDSDCNRSAIENSSDDDIALCYLLGALLHFLFAGTTSQSLMKDDSVAFGTEEPLPKKKSSHLFSRTEAKSPTEKCSSEMLPFVRGTAFSHAVSILGDEDRPDVDRNNEVGRISPPTPLIDLGYPFSLSQLVMNLIDCGPGLFRPDDSYPSLAVAISDMQILLREPIRFLWNHYNSPDHHNLFTNDVKLYGRSQEVLSLTNAFYRVTSAGRSESIFVGGFSGCGKTRLVQSIFDSVNIVGGYAVTRKFDEMNSSSPLNVVLSAFNELCTLVAQKSSQEHLISLHANLLASIGPNIMLLTSVLPNVVDLFPYHVELPVSNNQVGMNFDGLCFAVQCLMRVISSPSQPVLLFLDDLQWADNLSLKLVQYVLSDISGYNCLLFVGGFRENEIGQDHALLQLFNALSTSETMSSVIHLGGIGSNDVNSMISDTLGIFPRLCKGLSDVVFRKTNGNPFFTLEFLRSLIARGLVQFSLRNKFWTWNLNQISEENITDNVLQLLTRKINVLTETDQTALKVASCFGSSISSAIVQTLSSTSQYSSLQKTLDEMGVKEGFVDYDGTSYRFVHDKVREAAYGLIADKEQYHLDIGMALQLTSNDEVISTIQQITRSSPSLIKNSMQRISIANLGYEAGTMAMCCFDFTAAQSYFQTAISFLPTDSWIVHYNLTLKCHFQLAKAAYSCGWLHESKQICDEIIEHGESLDDILETYSLIVSLSCARKDLLLAFETCLKVLNLLGEEMPADMIDANEVLSITTKTKSLFQNFSNQELLDMREDECSRNVSIMDFFDQLTIVSFYMKPRVCQYYSSRWAFFCITNRVACKYTPGAFVSFASVLSQQGIEEDVRLACRIGKLGMIMLNKNDKAIDQVPGVYEVYFAWVGILTEPIQSQVAMYQHAHDIGMQSGNLFKAGIILGTLVARSIYAGTNLQDLKRDIELHLKSAKQNSQQLLHSYLSIEYDVVTRLIGDEKAESTSDIESESPVFDLLKFTLEMMVSFYLGHAERVHHKSKLWEGFSDFHRWKLPLGTIYVAFFSGLASFRLYTQGKMKSHRHVETLTKSLSILENASKFSEWNYKNKALLLKAAYFTVTGKNKEADKEFNAAICASQASKFVHEEGLACELAAAHHKKRGNNALALNLLRQADSCYKTWGSHIKKIHIARQVASMQV